MEKKSIITRICGGLGNQLFIYAMARRLALKNSVSLQLDIISGFKKDCFCRKYLLKYFNIQAEIANPYESFETPLGSIRRRVRMKMAQLRTFENRSYIIEKKRCFDPGILNLKISQKVYLQGLWQSEYYFKDIQHIIRQDLEIIRPHNYDTIKMAERMQNVNSISLHARSYHEVPREDGATTLNMEYYGKAINIIARNIDNPHFFCFSDNLDWLRVNLRIEFPVTFISHNTTHEDDNAIEDLWLMSQCKHHIIANSTFSWWGAWLNKATDKIIIAPGGAWNNHSLIPKNWFTF